MLWKSLQNLTMIAPDLHQSDSDQIRTHKIMCDVAHAPVYPGQSKDQGKISIIKMLARSVPAEQEHESTDKHWPSSCDGLTNRAGRTNRSTSCIYVQRRKMSVKRATKRHSIGLVEIVFTPSKKKSSCLIMISSELTGSNFGLSWTQFCVHIRMFKLWNGIPEQDSRTFKKAPPRYKIALANPKTSDRSGSRTVVWIFTAV